MGHFTIKSFGMVAEKLPASEIEFPYCKNTKELLIRLKEEYPHLQQLKFSIAVNKQLAQENIELQGNEEIALLPPFSGG